MTEQSKKNRIQTTKSWFSERYKKPCFLLKAISYSVISLLVILGLFSLINFALANFTDAISYTYMAPERLGQLGDFLGGTLNPIFGFATVCLLLWSVFIQRNELSLTRLELRKSSDALNGQLEQAHNESTRYQLGQLLEQEYKRLENIFFEQFNATGNEHTPVYRTFWAFKTLNEICQTDITDETKIDFHQIFTEFDPTITHEGEYEEDIAAMWLTMLKAHTTIKTITTITKDILRACELEPVERFWFSRWYDVMMKCHTVGVIGEEQCSDLLREIQGLRRSQDNLHLKRSTLD